MIAGPQNSWPYGVQKNVLLQDLPVCRYRRCVSRVEVPRKELFVHLSSTGKLRRSNPGWKFPMGKAAGRSASEPRCSLVNELERPTLWAEGEGRCLRDSNEHPPSGSSGVAGLACGGRAPVQDGSPTTVRVQPSQPRRIRTTEIAKGRRGSRRGAEYRWRAWDNRTRPEGRDPPLFTLSDEWRVRGLP